MNFRDLYLSADYQDNKGMLFNDDCMNLMSKMLLADNSMITERERE